VRRKMNSQQTCDKRDNYNCLNSKQTCDKRDNYNFLTSKQTRDKRDNYNFLTSKQTRDKRDNYNFLTSNQARDKRDNYNFSSIYGFWLPHWYHQSFNNEREVLAVMVNYLEYVQLRNGLYVGHRPLHFE
jgi:hypothetical protein